MKHRLLYGLLLTLPLAAGAEELSFSYNSHAAEPQGWGNGKAETVSVAARLYMPGLAGKQIKALSVPLIGSTEAMTDVSGFLTTELKTRNQNGSKINAPDICSINGTLDGNTLTVTFPEPYTIPTEGVYVGYTFTVTDAENAPTPVAVTAGNGAENTFWLQGTTSQMRWYDEGSETKMSSAMTVTLEGDFEENAAIPCLAGSIYTAGDTPATIDINIISMGTAPVKSIDYSYEAAGIKRSGVYNFPTAAESFSLSATLPLEIEPLGDPTMTTLNFTIDKVNGVVNGIQNASSSTPLEVLPFIPVNRPLVEEYTGLRCGYCPLGWIILKQMAEDYGRDEFVALSFHSAWFEKGAMVFLDIDEFPYTPDGYPASQVNRIGKTSVKDIPAEWSAQRKLMPEGEISVSIERDETNPDIIKAVSTSRFLHDNDDSHYCVTFALVADGLCDPEWLQYNAYRNTTENTSGFESEYWNLFLGKEENISGLVYDDIVVHMPDSKGIAGSLPAAIEAGKEYENIFTVDTSTLVNVMGKRTVTNFDKTRVVAIIVDSKTGQAVNCASSVYADGTGISSIPTLEESPVVDIIYHDLCGRRIPAPESGICLKTTIRKDGSYVTKKIVTH